ncbi:hypothetical protein [Streptomyces sp. NPDC005078]|uniref:hypothetical protein n=1 Tax=unclassified Streptomyces TaxID=2593676 RepID=UPI0033B7B00C
MVLPGRPPARGAGIAPAPDPEESDGLTTLALLAPNEHIVGDYRSVHDALSALRTDTTALTSQHPDHTFLPLPDVLREWQGAGIDPAILLDGTSLLRPRYAELGLHQLLPLDRVLVGARSIRPGAFGGFHHRDQGYRHLQMIAVTRYGDMETALPTAPDLALLDLLRAYAHDCLHYGSYRRYQLRDGQVIRTQYGINHRRSCGRTYSIPDRSDSAITRNLGVVMEGACDREARAITRKAAALHSVEITDRPHRFAFRDVTGQLDRSHLAEIETTAVTAPDETQAFIASLSRYETTVNRRYAHS